MSDFNETDHPRTDGGKFATKTQSEADGVVLTEPVKDASYYWGAVKAEPAELPDGLTAPSPAPIVKTTGEHLMGGDTIWQKDESGQLAEFKILESIPDAGVWGVPHTYLVRDPAGHEDEYTFSADDEVIAHRGDGSPEWFDAYHAGGHWYWNDSGDDENPYEDEGFYDHD